MTRRLLLLAVLPLLLLGGAGPAPAAAAAPAQGVAANRGPAIDGVVLEYTAIERGGTGRIRCVASDPDRDPLSYQWEASRGSLSGKGAQVTYTAPNSFVDVTIQVYVRDGRGGQAQQSVAFKVVCCGAAQKNPDWKPQGGK